MRRTLYLISYDIVCPKRLQRLHRELKKVALPIQYSVFLGSFTESGLVQLRALVTSHIDPRRDDVRLYPLPPKGWRRAMGRATFPQGILFTLASRSFAPEESWRATGLTSPAESCARSVSANPGDPLAGITLVGATYCKPRATR